MTLDEYQTQRALGSLTEAEIHKIAGAEDTPIETLQYIRDERTRQGQAWWLIGFVVNLNIDRRGGS